MEVIEKNGGPERDRTAGLLVANYETESRRRDAEEAHVIRRGSVHGAWVAVRCLSSIPERHPPTQPDAGRDGRVTTQGTTQTSCHPSGDACASGCPYLALTVDSEIASAPGQPLPRVELTATIRARLRRLLKWTLDFELCFEMPSIVRCRQDARLRRVSGLSDPLLRESGCGIPNAAVSLRMRFEVVGRQSRLLAISVPDCSEWSAPILECGSMGGQKQPGTVRPTFGRTGHHNRSALRR